MATKKYPTKSAAEKKEQVHQLLNQLNDGVLNFQYSEENYKAVLEMQALMPNYSFKNVLLIKAQLSTARYVASFKRWKELNRTVRRGEKAIRILAPKIKKEKDEVTGEENSELVGFIGVPVFDVSQTEGEPLPIDQVKLSLAGASAEAELIFNWTEKLATADGCTIQIGDGNGANGYYVPALHKIVVHSELSPNHKAKTAVHELVHSRLHRYLPSSAEERESVAEGVAYIVCTYFGLDTSEYSFQYVRGWSSDNGKSLLKYGEIIQKTAAKLIGEYESLASNASAECVPVVTRPTVRGVEIVGATSNRIPYKERKPGLYYYDVRQSDEGGEPASISGLVRVNHMATIITAQPFNGPEFDLSDDEAKMVLQAL